MKGVYPARDRIFTPWKNGGGETAEILISPHGAGFGDFDWRVSTALVAGDGPFSVFPGVERVLTVLTGGTMALTLDSGSVRLDPDSAPFAFAGDVPCDAVLTGAAVLDFNVMVRRPLAAVVKRDAFVLPKPGPRARLALLLKEAAGLQPFDLVDLDAADAGLINDLAGAHCLTVVITG